MKRLFLKGIKRWNLFNLANPHSFINTISIQLKKSQFEKRVQKILITFKNINTKILITLSLTVCIVFAAPGKDVTCSATTCSNTDCGGVGTGGTIAWKVSSNPNMCQVVDCTSPPTGGLTVNLCTSCSPTERLIYPNTAATACVDVDCAKKADFTDAECITQTRCTACIDCSKTSGWTKADCIACNTSTYKKNTNATACIDCSKTSGWTSAKCNACDTIKPYSNTGATACVAINCNKTNGWTDTDCITCDSTQPQAALDATSCEASSSYSVILAFASALLVLIASL